MSLSQQTLVIVTEGGETPSTPIAGAMREWRDRLTVEAIHQLLSCKNIFLLVCTNRYFIQQYCKECQVPFYDTGSDKKSLGSFNYLETIQNICKTYAKIGISSAIVVGGAALPLAKTNDFQLIMDSLQDSQECVWANNPLSPDIVGWIPIETIGSICHVQNDNELAAALRDQAHLQYQMWPRMLTYSYDVDTPVDLWIAVRQKKPAFYYIDQDTQDHDDAYTANLTNQFSDQLADQLLDEQLLKDQLLFLGDQFLFGQLELTISNLLDRICKKNLPNITVIGRVSPQTVQFLNQTVKARVRCFSEERGMKGLQRDKQGMVWSLVADWFERFGNYEEAFDLLAQESDAIFMDTRVWMAHHRLELTEEDRFASDLMLEERIGQDKLRKLTRAARSCKVPVLLGGFGLVNQGIRLLLQAPENKSASPSVVG